MLEPLTAPYVLEYTYTRTTGPVIGRFLGALTEKRVLGARTSDGSVVVPPTEYDPHTGDPTKELVPVADTGTITAHTWVALPRGAHLRKKPFAWVLVRLDGADTSMLHLLDAPSPESVRAGMRVKIRWAEERKGAITDIEGFELVEATP